MLIITSREAPSLVAGRGVTVYHHALRLDSARSQDRTMPPRVNLFRTKQSLGLSRYHTMLEYQYDNKTSIHPLVAGHTTRANHHARGTLTRWSYSPSLYHHAQGNSSPDVSHPIIIVYPHVDIT